FYWSVHPNTVPLLPVGAVSSSQDGISAAEVELRVRPGDNITLYCDCIITTGVYIIWYRNCSHKYQPPLVISIYNVYQNLQEMSDNSNRFPGYNVLWNPSNKSYDLLIENITESDLGLYYCGTRLSWEERQRMQLILNVPSETNLNSSNVSSNSCLNNQES
uniref:Ig-like domain-containing protein n=1 Tax=Oncorhynchus kisutch TaxID=8019 RepID=A0A8C7KA77_ONCKI